MPRTRVPLLQATRATPGTLPLFLELARTLKDCASVLDLGCGNNSPLTTLRTQRLVGFEGFEPALAEAKARATHDDWVLGDVRKLGELLGERRFDACVALDLIEHLPKEDGWRLLDAMERVATRKVIVFTPNGFLPQRGHNDLQEHLSGWVPAELRNRGYRVIGFYGHKTLRGEYHRLKKRPKIFWGVVSLLSQLYVRHRPDQAAALYCVKDQRISLPA